MRISEEKLQLLRAKQGKSLKEIGVTPRIQSRIRKGQDLQVRTIHRIAKSLDCEIEDLIDVGGGINDSNINTAESN